MTDPVENDLMRALEGLRPRMTERQIRLFGCACVRLIWPLLGDPRSRTVVEVAEQFVDGRATARELHVAADHAKYVRGIGAAAPPLVAWPEFDRILPSRYNITYSVPRVIAGALAAVVARAAPPGSDWIAARDAAWDDAYTRQRSILLDIAGPARRPAARAWPGHVTGLAQACYDGAPDHPILADALEELGESKAAAHFRRPPHVKGCWVLDWVLGWDGK